MTLLKKFSAPLIAVALVAVMAISLLGQQGTAEAAATSNNTTTAISLAANVATGSNAFTTLPAITITCGAINEITAGASNGTTGIALTLAGGWTYTGGVAPTAVYGTGVTGDATGTIASATSITFTTTAACSGAGLAATISGVQVKPTTALAANTTIVADIAVTDPTAATITATAANFIDGGGTLTATKVGSTLTTVTAAIPAGITSATFQTTGGTFTANGSGTLFCGEATGSCDMIGTNAIQVQLALPASGSTTVTVTPTGGTASSITITVTAAQILSSITVTPTTALIAVAAGGNADISVRLTDQTGAAFTAATTVTVATDRGVIASDGTTCDTSADDTQDAGSDASCTWASTGATVSLELFGTDSPGTATVTITAVQGTTTVTATKTVTLTGGVVNTVTIETASANSTISGAFTAKTIVNDKQSTTNVDEMIVIVKAFDTNGVAIAPTAANVTFTITTAAGANAPDFFTGTGVLEEAVFAVAAGDFASGGVSLGGARCIDDIDAGAGLVTLLPHAACVIDIDSTTGIPHGTYTITAEVGTGTALRSATKTITVAGVADTVTVAATPSSIGIGSTARIAATVLDATGKPIADGTVVTFATSTGLFTTLSTTGTVSTTANTVAGVAQVDALSLAAGTGQIFAVVGGKTGSVNVTVGSTPTPPVVTPPVVPPAGTVGVFTGGTIAPQGVSIVSFTGTVAQLGTAGTAAKVVSASATTGGKMITYVVGAPDFVNAEFNAAFPAGLSATFLILKTGT